jgi:plasmid stabilization system protein ParE
MKVQFTRQAFAEREAIFNYLEERSPQGAYSVISRIQAGISRLAEFPESGHATDIPDVRVLFIGHFPYKSSTAPVPMQSRSCTYGIPQEGPFPRAIPGKV